MSNADLNNPNAREAGVAATSDTRKVTKKPSGLLSITGAAALAVAAAMTPHDAGAEWVNDGCFTPSTTGAVCDLAGDPDTDDHAVLSQADYGLYLKNLDASGYTNVDSVIESYDPSRTGHIFRPQSIEDDNFLILDYNTDDILGLSLSELRAGSLTFLDEYDGEPGSSCYMYDGRVFGTTSSDNNTVYEFTVGEDPTVFFSDPSHDDLLAIAVDLDEDIAYSTVYPSGNVREYTGISETISSTDLSFDGQVSELVHEDDASRGYRTLWVIDWDAASGGDLCAYVENSYPTPVDTDGDGIIDDEDDCPTEDATGYDTDSDGCVDDLDDDGFPANADCDDEDEYSYPGADEFCDGVDNDCDEEVDEDSVDASTWYPDEDGDGSGNPDGAVEACEQPDGYVDNGEDCDDSDIDMITDCDTVVDLDNGLSVEVSQGNAENSVSFDPETGVLSLLVDGIQYTINVGSSPILAEWTSEGLLADLGSEARAEIMLGILAGAVQAPPPPSGEFGECEDGVQYGPVDTDDQNRWMTVTLLEPGTTKSTVELIGSRDMVDQFLTKGETLSVADTTYCPDEPTDSDGDGVVDDEDACPDEFGEGDDGCPEGDDDTGNPNTDAPDQPTPTNPDGYNSCAVAPGTPVGPEGLALAAMLMGLLARRRKEQKKD